MEENRTKRNEFENRNLWDGRSFIGECKVLGDGHEVKKDH